MNIFKKNTLSCIALFLMLTSKAQIAGVFNVPVDFPTIAAAINTLNIVGVAGAVTINVTAGHTETAPAGGYKLNTVAGASATSAIVFQKSGAGANPLITAFTGTATPVSIVVDAVWILQGSDYITIDGIDITDPNTSGAAMMEIGFGLYKTSASNGCQYNTIKNCVITLNTSNAPNGINVMNRVFTAGQLLIIGTAAGTNSYNKFYSNTILNCNTGIYIYGYDGNTPGNTSDRFNDIGGTSAATGNNIVNFGGGPNNTAYGIDTYWQYDFNASYNVLNNNNGSGLSPTGDLYAINSAGNLALYADLTLNSNTITLSSNGTGTNALTGIMNAVGSAFSNSSSNTVTINNNVIAGYTYSVSGTATPGAAPNCTLICNKTSYAVANINGNLINNVSVGSGTFNVISMDIPYICSASSNTISNVEGNGSGFMYMIRCTSPYNATVNYNVIDNISWSNSTNTSYLSHIMYGIYCPSIRTSGNINNNSISNYSTIANSSGFTGITDGGLSLNRSVQNNKIYNFTSTSPNGYFGFTGIKTHNSSSSSASSTTVSANSIYSISQAGSYTNGITNNASFTGVDADGSGKANIYGNSVSSFSATAYSCYLRGITAATATNNISNNVIGDFNLPNCHEYDGAIGLYLSGSLNTIYYNSVYLNAVSTGSYFGSSAVLHINGNIDLRNNILINTSNTAGAGFSAVIKRVVTGLTSYLSTSNNNLLYAGTPTASNVILYDGTNTYSTLPLFKSFVTPRETQSFSEAAPFVSTNGLSPSFLNINPSIATQVEGGALPITSYTNDYNTTARNTVTPDVGAFEGNYIPKDIFPPAIGSSGFTSGACGLTSRTFTAALSDPSGIASGTLSPRVYYRVNFGLYTSTAGTLTAGTATNGVWTFSLAYTASAGNTIYYFIAAQDQEPTPNVVLAPSAGGSASNVNAVAIPPSPANSYTVLPINSGTISPASLTLCAGGSTTLTSAGASFEAGINYQWQSSTVAGGSYTNTAGGSGATSTSYSSAALTAGTYYFIMTATCGSSGTVSVSNEATVAVNAIPTATASVSAATLCAGNTVSLTATGAGATGYSWSGPNSFTSNIQAPVITNASSNATGDYTLVASANGCASAPSIVSVTVTALPSLSIAGNTTICTGQTTTLTASGANSYSWNTTATSESISISPIINTDYTVTGTNMAGCKSSKTITVVSNTLPVIAITPTAAAVCYSSSVTFTALGAATYSWVAGPNTNMLSILVTSPMVYTVNGTNVQGCSSSNTVAVSSYSLPVVSITPASATVCALSPVSFTAGGAASYTWNGNAPGATVSYTPAANAVYSVSASSSQGCVGTATVAVTTSSLPVLAFSPLTPTICQQASVTINVSGASSYTWNNTGATTSSLHVFPSTTTVYSVTGLNANGCISHSTLAVSVFTVPVISITTPSSVICPSTDITLTASGADTYSWVSGPNTATYSVNPVVATSYIVNGTSLNGCKATTLIAINVYSQPVISITPASATVCALTPVSFTASGASNLTWNGNAPGATASFTPAANTSYSVSGSSAESCIAHTVVAVNVNPLPVLLIAPATKTICDTETAEFTVSGADTYTWMPGNISGASLVVSPSVTSTYSVAGTDVASCTNTATATLVIDPCVGLQQNPLSLNNIVVFPNPSKGIVTITFAVEGEKTLVVTSAVGQLIQQTTTRNISETLDLGGHAKGVYFINISVEGVSKNYKVILD